MQWAPQIVKTVRARSVGSVSMAMLAIQAPGSFLVVYFQWFLRGENVSTWISYFLAGVQQVLLLSICLLLVIHRCLRRRRQAQLGTLEKAPLMASTDSDILSNEQSGAADVGGDVRSTSGRWISSTTAATAASGAASPSNAVADGSDATPWSTASSASNFAKVFPTTLRIDTSE